MGDIILMIKLYQESRQARYWIKYSVIPSFIPVILIVAYDCILGCDLVNIINRHLVDFILVVFAVVVSVYCSANELKKKMKSDSAEEKSDNYVLFSLLAGIWCTAFFTFFYDRLKPEESLSCEKIGFCFAQIFLTYLVFYFGMKTEKELESLPKTSSSESTNNKQSQEENPPDV